MEWPAIPLKATWKRIDTHIVLPRTSHSLSIVKDKAYVFGGQPQPYPEPIDNDVHVFALHSPPGVEVDYQVIQAKSITADLAVPCPRSGHTASTVNDRIYVFGGRGGRATQPLEENGRVWVFDTKVNQWSHLDPAEDSPYPVARAYHVSTATQHPMRTSHIDKPVIHWNPPPGDVLHIPQEEIDGSNVPPLGPAFSGFDDHGTIFIHGGCPARGRFNDVWAFDIASRLWTQFPDAPGPPRGGPCLVLSQDRLYRFGGFEIGGPMQFLRLEKSSFSGKEVAVSPLIGRWESVGIPVDMSLPGDRSVAGLQPVTTGQGQHYLLLFLGVRDPRCLEEEDAPLFWEDVWSFQLRPPLNIKDATKQLFGGEPTEGIWAKVDVPESSMPGDMELPSPRAWFVSAKAHDLGPGSVVLWGGEQEDDSSAGDGWILTVDS